MKCFNCGTDLPNGAGFCTACGAQQPAQPVQPVAPVYQQPVQPEAPVYAQPTQDAYQPAQPVYAQPPVGQPEAPAEPPKKKKTGLIIGIVAAILAVIAAVVLCIFFLGGDNKKTNNDNKGDDDEDTSVVDEDDDEDDDDSSNGEDSEPAIEEEENNGDKEEETATVPVTDMGSYMTIFDKYGVESLAEYDGEYKSGEYYAQDMSSAATTLYGSDCTFLLKDVKIDDNVYDEKVYCYNETSYIGFSEEKISEYKNMTDDELEAEFGVAGIEDVDGVDALVYVLVYDNYVEVATIFYSLDDSDCFTATNSTFGLFYTDTDYITINEIDSEMLALGYTKLDY